MTPILNKPNLEQGWKFLWKPEYNVLASYNSEVSRGVLHTNKWKEKMRQLQNNYNVFLKKCKGI